MRRVSGDPLNVNTGNRSAGGVNNFNIRVPSQGIFVRQSAVVPAHDNWSFAFCHRRLLGNDGNKITGIIDLLEEFQPGGYIIKRATIIQCSRVDAHLSLGRGTGITG